MSPLKVYKIAALFLLVLNLALIAVIVLAPGRSDGPPLHAASHFGFTEEQDERFLNFARAHQNKMIDYNARQTKLLRDYFRQLTTSGAESPTPPAPEILEIERRKIESTYAHFLEVRSLLTPEQERQYPTFVDTVLARVLLPVKEVRPR
jgi:hypothetical protein